MKEAVIFLLKKFAHESEPEAQAHIDALTAGEALVKDGVDLAKAIEKTKE